MTDRQTTHVPRRTRSVSRGGRLIVAAAVVLGVSLRLLQLNPALAQSTEIVAWQGAAGQPMGPAAAIWRNVPPIELPLTAQNVSLPMGGGSIATLEVKALHADGRIYLHLAWPDVTADERTDAVEAFADAVAVQLPAVAGAAVPAICMGQIDQGVNIWQWRADSQRGIADAPGDGYVDVHPDNGDLDYPARVVGNPLADPAAGSAQNLVAGGFGTLEPAVGDAVAATADYTAGGWTAVFERALAAPDPNQPELLVEATTDLVFAVWDGSAGDRDGQKSVSTFATLRLTADAAPSPAHAYIIVVLVLAALLAVIGVGSYVVCTPLRAPSTRRPGSPSRP